MLEGPFPGDPVVGEQHARVEANIVEMLEDRDRVGVRRRELRVVEGARLPLQPALAVLADGAHLPRLMGLGHRDAPVAPT